MEFLQVVILFILLLLLVNLIQNLNRLRRQDTTKNPETYPFVSVLIPARNEERNIVGCVTSLSQSDYPRMEIIVLDDNSTDKTFEVAKKLSTGEKNLRVVKGKELPEGWTGKNWSCHQLSEVAGGEWLLFTDADTRHTSRSISVALASALESKSGFLTCIPGLIAKTWSEKLFMPIIHFAFLVLIPFKLLNIAKDSRLPLGIGPFILIKNDCYSRCGGHESIKGKIVDDMALAKKVKKDRGKISVIDGTDVVSLRFYTSFKSLWKGFSKNCYGALGGSLYRLVGVFLGCYFLFIYPYLSLWGAIQAQQSVTLPLLQVLTISLTRIIMALRFKASLIFALLHPLSIIFVLSILLNSFRLSFFKKKFEWKERFYLAK